MIDDLQHRWSLTIHDPFLSEDVSCAWVALVALFDGAFAVLKIGMPHMEAEHEIQGLQFWNGDPTVRLLAYDVELNAMLLERCEPGTTLRALSGPEQDVVIASLLRRMWRTPGGQHSFRPLSAMLAQWTAETLAYAPLWSNTGPDAGLVREGLRLFEELPRTAPADVLLATDLHVGNVLRARREPWLVIDPKPFLGDPAYDATQYLFNCEDRLLADPEGLIRRMADLLEIDDQRLRLWTFARCAAEPRSD